MGERPPRSPDIFTPEKRKTAALSAHKWVFPDSPVPLAFHRGTNDAIMKHMRSAPCSETEQVGFFDAYLGPRGLRIPSHENLGKVLAEANTIQWRLGPFPLRRAPERKIEAQNLVDHAFLAYRLPAPEVLITTDEHLAARMSARRWDDFSTRVMLDLNWDDNLWDDNLPEFSTNQRQTDELWEVDAALQAAIEGPIGQLETTDKVKQQLATDASRFARLTAAWFLFEHLFKKKVRQTANPWYPIFGGFGNGYWSLGQVQHKGKERFLVCPLW